MFERKTAVSDFVIKLFKKNDSPLSVNQILYSLNQQSLFPNKSTVYRIIDKLKKQQFICEVPLKYGPTYFELNRNLHHHHHFFCNHCEKLFCLDVCNFDFQDLISSQFTKQNISFKIQSHDFNLYGVCDVCQKE